jgi:hypothetical protein
MVRKQAWGWFGARHARAGPVWLATEVCFTFWFGNFQT